MRTHIQAAIKDAIGAAERYGMALAEARSANDRNFERCERSEKSSFERLQNAEEKLSTLVDASEARLRALSICLRHVYSPDAPIWTELQAVLSPDDFGILFNDSPAGHADRMARSDNQ